LFPYENFDEVMQKLKEEHPKGRHFVYAYRYINEYEQIVENQSDDGEPKGSSGPPVLAVLRGENLVDTAVIIVRYFGGIKLGVGGLVRAYGKSVHQALELALKDNHIENYLNLIYIKYNISINHLGKLEHLLKDFKDIIIEKEFVELSVLFHVKATEDDHEKLKTIFDSFKYD
jgi:uncharacterized YigZ family protein